MAGKPSSDNVLLGKGKLMFDRLDSAGIRTGFIALGNCSEFSIATEVEKLEMKSSLDKAAATYKEIAKEKKVSLKITGFEFEVDVLAQVLMGDKGEYTQAATPVTSEVIAAAGVQTVKKGRFFKTAKRNISAVTLRSLAVVLVSGTDYEIYDADAGVIFILSTSPNVVEANNLNIDYTPALISAGSGRQIISGATQSKIEGVLLFLPDPSTGPKLEAEIWRASLSPEGELGFISEEFASWGLSGSAQDDSAGQYGGSAGSPFYRLLKRAA